MKKDKDGKTSFRALWVKERTLMWWDIVFTIMVGWIAWGQY